MAPDNDSDMYKDAPYLEPASFEEAAIRRDTLGQACQEIQGQLGSRDQHIEGRRMTNEEYWSWKKRAQIALNCKLREMRYLKQWMTTHPDERQAKRAQSLVPDDLTGLRADIFARIGCLIDLVKQLRAENEELRRANAVDGAPVPLPPPLPPPECRPERRTTS